MSLSPTRHRHHPARISGVGCDCGSVTAEFAVVVPAVLVLVGLVLGVVATHRNDVLQGTLASQAARALARGESEDSVIAEIRRTLPGATAEVTHPDDSRVCVRISFASAGAMMGTVDSVNMAAPLCVRTDL